MGDLGVQVSVRSSSVRSSVRQHLPLVSCERNSFYSFVQIVLKLCMFFFFFFFFFFFHRGCVCDSDIIVRSFLLQFQHCELGHLSLLIYRQWVPLVRGTSLTVLYRSF